MDGEDKLLLPVQGTPLVRRTFLALREAGLDPVVVTGHRPDRIHAILNDLRITFAHNPDYARGQQSSVLIGLAAVPTGVDAVIVALADLPLLSAADIRLLMQAYGSRAPGRAILVPVHQGVRGNPVIFDSALIPDILTGSRNDPVGTGRNGARAYIDRHPHLVQWLETPNDAFCIDLDTREDLEALRVRLDAEPH